MSMTKEDRAAMLLWWGSEPESIGGNLMPQWAEVGWRAACAHKDAQHAQEISEAREVILGYGRIVEEADVLIHKAVDLRTTIAANRWITAHPETGEKCPDQAHVATGFADMAGNCFTCGESVLKEKSDG